MEKGHKVIVITEVYQSKGKSAKVAGETGGIKIYRIPVGRENWSKKFRIWWQLLKLKEIIRDADIVHCHDVFFWYLIFRFLYPKKAVYTTFHGYEDYPIPKKAILVRKISEYLSMGNICVGDFITKWYGTNPSFVIYGGVDIKTQNSKLPTSPLRSFSEGGLSGAGKTQNHSSKLKIVFIGRLDSQTGIMKYLKALKILKEKKYEFKLDVFGDGIKYAKCKEFCSKYNLNVEFHGFVNNATDFLVESDWVFVSRYLGILEAMAAKRLVFAVYDNPIKKDYLQRTPFSKLIIIANSKEEIFSKAKYFLENPEEEKKIIDKAYNWVKDQTWEKVNETYMDLWYKKK